MALPLSNGIFRTFAAKMKPSTTTTTSATTDLLTSSSTSPTNNSTPRSRLSFSVDSLLSRKQVVDQRHPNVDDNDVENYVCDDDNDNDSDESVDVEDTSSDLDEKASPATSPSRLPVSHPHHNNNNENVVTRHDVNSDESFKEYPVLRHPPFLAGIVAMAAAAAAAANSTSTTPSTPTPTSHLSPWPSPGPGFPIGLPGLRPPMFHKPGGKFYAIFRLGWPDSEVLLA